MARELRKLSRLGVFLEDNDVKPVELAEVAGVSRQHVYRLRYGQMEPTRPMMVWITMGCRRILRRHIRVSELFDLGG